MGTFSKPLDLYRHQLKRFQTMQRDMVKAHVEIAKGGKQDLVDVTGGGIKAETLRKMGHPYGRGASAAKRKATGLKRSGRAPLLPINVQSGQLRAMIFMRKVGATSYDVGSGAKHGRYILHPAGTKKMVGRGVMSGRNIGFNGPAMFLEKRFKARDKAFKDAFIRKQRRP